MSDSRIGNMNGPWAMGLKFVISTYPIVLAGLITWAAWVTSEVFESRAFRDRGDRFSSHDAAALEERIRQGDMAYRASLNTKLDSLVASDARTNQDLAVLKAHLEILISELRKQQTK